MLFKNGKEFEIPKAELDHLNKTYPNFPKTPVAIKMPGPFKTQPGNKKPDKPAGHHIPTKGIRVNKDGISEEFRYAETVLPAGKDGVQRYSPSQIEIPHYYHVQDMELLWFLYYVSPYSTNGKNSNGSVSNLFEFENKIQEAKDFITKNRDSIRGEALIVDPDAGLDVKALEALYDAYFLVKEDGATEDMLRSNLYQHLKLTAKSKGPEIWTEFLTRAKDIKGPVVKIKGAIQRAINDDAIRFFGTDKKWYFMDGDAKASAVHDSPMRKANPQEGLFEYFSSNEKAFTSFEKALKSEPPKEDK